MRKTAVPKIPQKVKKRSLGSTEFGERTYERKNITEGVKKMPRR